MTDNKLNIQWYPGHMAKARRLMQEDMKMIDLVIEILRGSKTLAMAKKCLMTGETEGIKFRYKGSEFDAQELHLLFVHVDAFPLSSDFSTARLYPCFFSIARLSSAFS